MTQACEYIIEGRADGPTLVFVHGWPDNASLWRKQVAVLGDRYRCVLITLPNFGESAELAGGCDMPELAERVAAVIHEVQPGGSVGLVTHDWGAYIGYLLEQRHPQLISRLAAFDVGGHLLMSGLKSSLMIISYQWALIACWLAGGIIPPLGRLLTRSVARIIGVPRRQRETIRSRYNYPYFYFWRAMLVPGWRDRFLRRYRPQCPVMYLFGEAKPVMFHSEKWLEIVADGGGRAEGLAGAGHWLMETHAETVNARLLDWFDEVGNGAD
jgi:pimeloyl-ACP methyl ester carboxylesterase